MNKKITLYELLGLIKDGKAPKKIKYDEMIWEYDGDYYSSKNNVILEEYCNLTTSLNDEVEILEEEKNSFTGWKMYQNGKEVASMDCSYDEAMEIEELGWIDYNIEFTHEDFNREFRNICNTIDKLVREVNKLKKGK